MGVILIATLVIAYDILSLYDSVAEALRYSVFQVGSILTTTGYATADLICGRRCREQFWSYK